MTDINLDSLPDAVEFSVSDLIPGKKFNHDGYIFRAGQSYILEDFPKISKDEVFMFWRAGWINVNGWPDNPGIDKARHVTLEVKGHAVKTFNREVS